MSTNPHFRFQAKTSNILHEDSKARARRKTQNADSNHSKQTKILSKDAKDLIYIYICIYKAIARIRSQEQDNKNGVRTKISNTDSKHRSKTICRNEYSYTRAKHGTSKSNLKVSSQTMIPQSSIVNAPQAWNLLSRIRNKSPKQRLQARNPFRAY